VDVDAFYLLLRRQAGVFTRAQALECGLRQEAAAKAVANGRWRRVAGAGFVLAGEPVGMEQGAWAAVLSIPSGVVWGPSAFKLWMPDAPLPPRDTVLVAVQGHARGRPGITVRQVEVPSTEAAIRRGVAVQSKAAALVDALAHLGLGEADGLLAWALARDAATPDGFDALVGARGGRRHVRRLRGYADMWRSGAGSAAEVAFQRLLHRHGFAGWEANARIVLGGGGWARADVLFRRQRLVIEVDGRAFHSSKDAFQGDRSKQNDLVAAGFAVLRFTWEDITCREAYCAERIRQMLGRPR
jgi:very-short-patch-repair endonuclease